MDIHGKTTDFLKYPCFSEQLQKILGVYPHEKVFLQTNAHYSSRLPQVVYHVHGYIGSGLTDTHKDVRTDADLASAFSMLLVQYFTYIDTPHGMELSHGEGIVWNWTSGGLL